MVICGAVELLVPTMVVTGAELGRSYDSSWRTGIIKTVACQVGMIEGYLDQWNCDVILMVFRQHFIVELNASWLAIIYHY